ncbi:hypothetical protein [Paenibacillus lactis]
MNIPDSLTVFRKMLDRHSIEGYVLRFSEREALKTAIKELEKIQNTTK